MWENFLKGKHFISYLNLWLECFYSFFSFPQICCVFSSRGCSHKDSEDWMKDTKTLSQCIIRFKRCLLFLFTFFWQVLFNPAHTFSIIFSCQQYFLKWWYAKDFHLCCSQSKSAFLLCFIFECIFFCLSRSRFIFSTLKHNEKIL